MECTFYCKKIGLEQAPDPSQVAVVILAQGPASLLCCYPIIFKRGAEEHMMEHARDRSLYCNPPWCSQLTTTYMIPWQYKPIHISDFLFVGLFIAKYHFAFIFYFLCCSYQIEAPE